MPNHRPALIGYANQLQLIARSHSTGRGPTRGRTVVYRYCGKCSARSLVIAAQLSGAIPTAAAYGQCADDKRNPRPDSAHPAVTVVLT